MEKIILTKFRELYFVALENLEQKKLLDAAGNATKNGMIKIIDLETSSSIKTF